MRNKTLSVLALLLSLSIYFSCIDEGVEVSGLQYKHSEPELLSYAKKMVGENGEGCSLIDLRKGSTNSRVVTDYSTVATPLWEKAKTEKHGDEEVLIVPLQSEDDIYSSLYFEEEEMGRLYQTKTFSKLVVRSKNGHTVTQVFTYLPGRNYAKNRQAVLDTMGFSPLAVKYYGTILISDLEGKFQQGFYYERGVPTIHLTPKRHTHTTGSRSINDSTECDHHEHSHSMDIRLRLSGNMRIASRSSDEGEEIEFPCMFCGQSALTCSCFTVEGNYVYCDDCGNLKGQCVCLPTMTACGVCGMYYCICFEPCEECGSYPCVCDELIGGGNNSGGDNLGGGGSGGGSNPGNNSDTGGGDGSEPFSCKNLEEVLEYIPLRLALKGIYLNNIQIVEEDSCSLKSASVNFANNWIKICPDNFYKWPIEDQTSIVYHEYHHLTYDRIRRDEWDSSTKILEDPLFYEMPPEIVMIVYRKEYKEEYDLWQSNGSFLNVSLDEYIINQCCCIYKLLPPERYQQEISAYQDERNMFPIVSDDYNALREFNLWTNQQAFKCSKNNYYKL